jgi:hypothetical protein
VGGGKHQREHRRTWGKCGDEKLPVPFPFLPAVSPLFVLRPSLFLPRLKRGGVGLMTAGPVGLRLGLRGAAALLMGGQRGGGRGSGGIDCEGATEASRRGIGWRIHSTP